jgi:LysM repeat protein
VGAPDAVMLAHLVMDGTHLAYVLWPASATLPDATPPPLDDRAVRAALGLSTATPAATTASAPLEPTPTPTGPASGFLYQVQPNDTWNGIAVLFGVSADELRRWNEAIGQDDPAPGSLVFIPRQS